MTYVRERDIFFQSEDHEILCKTILRDLRDLQRSIVFDEENTEALSSRATKSVALAMNQYNDINRKMATAMKLTFWFYTGKNPDMVIEEEEPIDIFDPLKK